MSREGISNFQFPMTPEKNLIDFHGAGNQNSNSNDQLIVIARSLKRRSNLGLFCHCDITKWRSNLRSHQMRLPRLPAGRQVVPPRNDKEHWDCRSLSLRSMASQWQRYGTSQWQRRGIWTLEFNIIPCIIIIDG